MFTDCVEIEEAQGEGEGLAVLLFQFVRQVCAKRTSGGDGHADYVNFVNFASLYEKVWSPLSVEECRFFIFQNSTLNLVCLLIPILNRVCEVALKLDQVISRSSECPDSTVLAFDEYDCPLLKNEE